MRCAGSSGLDRLHAGVRAVVWGMAPVLLLPFCSYAAGISSDYPNDRSIESDPRVLYAENWDRPRGRPPADWHRRTKYSTMRIDRPRKWPVRGGVPFPPAWSKVNVGVGEGVGGGNALRVTMWEREWGTGSPTFDVGVATGAEAEHLFYRYYVKFDPAVSRARRCDGGKLPGFAGRTDVAGNSGDGRSVRGGTRGWSLRGGYGVNCPHEKNHPRVAITTYAYHAAMKGVYGSHWRWGYVDVGRWICIEGEVRVNTPGIRDGVLRGWIDGEPAIEKTDLYLRGEPPYHPRLARTPYGVPSTLGIRKFWGTLHHGGRYGMFDGGPGPAGDTEAHIWLDQTVVATERIGCMR